MKDPYAAGGRERDRPVAISATRPQTMVVSSAQPVKPAPTYDVAPPPTPPARMTPRDVDAALRGKRRSRRFNASALLAGRSQTAADLRKLIGAKVRDVEGRQLGKVHSVIAPGESLGESWVVVEEGRGGRRYYLPADRVDGATGGAWTSLHRDQVLATTALVPGGRLTATSERLLRNHYAPTLTSRKRYSEIVARERLIRRSRTSSVVQRASQR